MPEFEPEQVMLPEKKSETLEKVGGTALGVLALWGTYELLK